MLRFDKVHTTSLLVLLACAIVASCRDATQIRIRVVTNLTCPGSGTVPELVDASVLAGAARKVSGPAQASTATCEAGVPNVIGDIVVHPREAKDGTAEVWVVAARASAARLSAQACLDSYEALVRAGTTVGFPDDCFIAKRRIGFVPHEGLELTILIDDACGGTACNPDETCYDAKRCGDSNTTCKGNQCLLPNEGLGGAGGAGGASASSGTGSAVDTTTGTNSTSTSDASSGTGGVVCSDKGCVQGSPTPECLSCCQEAMFDGAGCRLSETCVCFGATSSIASQSASSGGQTCQGAGMMATVTQCADCLDACLDVGCTGYVAGSCAPGNMGFDCFCEP